MLAVQASVRRLLLAGSALAPPRPAFYLRSSSFFETRRLYNHGAGTALSTSNQQVYTNPTYDAAFKWVLNFDNVRQAFFRSFIPGTNIQSSLWLDDSMNPVQHSQLLRKFLHDKSTSDIVKSLKSRSAYVVRDRADGNIYQDERATLFLHEMVTRFDSIKGSLPRPQYDGKMDFACLLSNGEYALVEMQVIPENHWDRRALAYVAAFYGNQLTKGGNWKDLRRVIGVNIVGGGIQNKIAWPETPNQFMRHYKFEDQLNGKGRFVDGIELFQYSIMNAPTVADQGMADWMTFLRNAHRMTEEDVLAQIKTPAVLEAFERAKISELPADVRAAYDAQNIEYDRYSQHTEEQIFNARMQVAEKMIQSGVTLNDIQAYTGLSSADIEGIIRKGC